MLKSFKTKLSLVMKISYKLKMLKNFLPGALTGKSGKLISKVTLLSVFSVSTLIVPISCYSSDEYTQEVSLNTIVDADGSLKRVMSSGVLRIGADPNTGLPFLKKDKFAFDYKGFEFEVSKYVASQLGCKVKIVPTNWENLIPGLENKKYDIVLNALEKPEDNKETSKNIGYSKSYYTNSQQIIVTKDSKDIKYLIDLKGKKVGVLNDSIAKVMISELNKMKHAGITMVMYTNTKDLFSSLQRKLIDSVLADSAMGSWNCQEEANNCKQVGIPIFPKNYVIAVRKEDRALLNGIDAIIREGKKNSKIVKILNKWNLE